MEIIPLGSGPFLENLRAQSELLWLVFVSMFVCLSVSQRLL